MMTDNEITIKALKELLEVMLNEGDLQRTSTISHTIDLINRQDEKINRLQAENERLQAYHDDMESAIYQFREDHAKVKFFKKEIKAEAYTEFAERLKEKMPRYSAQERSGRFSESTIDNILEEMVGEDNA